MRRFVAGLAAFALLLTLGLQGMQAIAMATSKGEMSMSMTPDRDASSGDCTNCDGPGKGAAIQCPPMCVPPVAVLSMSQPIGGLSPPAPFEAANMTRDGRTGTPELHPPKPTRFL
jgi:hypothetical protein